MTPGTSSAFISWCRGGIRSAPTTSRPRGATRSGSRPARGRTASNPCAIETTEANSAKHRWTCAGLLSRPTVGSDSTACGRKAASPWRPCSVGPGLRMTLRLGRRQHAASWPLLRGSEHRPMGRRWRAMRCPLGRLNDCAHCHLANHPREISVDAAPSPPGAKRTPQDSMFPSPYSTATWHWLPLEPSTRMQAILASTCAVARSRPGSSATETGSVTAAPTGLCRLAGGTPELRSRPVIDTPLGSAGRVATCTIIWTPTLGEPSQARSRNAPSAQSRRSFSFCSNSSRSTSPRA